MWMVLAGCGGETYLEVEAAADLDYLLDRPRVLAIGLDPPAVRPEEPVTIDVLALAPRGEAIERIELDLCTLGADFPTWTIELDCHNVPEYVESLGAAPLSWTPPRRDGFDCDRMQYAWEDSAEFVCASSNPLLARATTDQGREALGSIDVTLPFDDALPYLPDPQASWVEGLSLTIGGEPRPGGTLELVAEALVTEPNSFADVRWFVDAGELDATGRTQWEAASAPSDSGLTATQRGEPAPYVTRNQLRVPADFRGPLRVVVASIDRLEADWVVQTVEVRDPDAE